MLTNIDTTDIKVDKSLDAFAQMQTFSGDRQKGHCYLFSNITCSLGSILAVSPGPQISCPPRGGDGVSLGVQLGQAEQRQQLSGVSEGFTKLLQGTPNLGVGLDFDNGYVYQPNVNQGTNPSLLDYCQQNDILPLFRTKVGRFAFIFNRQTNLLEQVQNNRDETRAANSARIATYLRAASENAHTFKQIYKYFKHKAHNSRLVAVGMAKINYYDRLFSKQLGAEYAEMAKINIEYLVMVGLYNRWHAKFAR